MYFIICSVSEPGAVATGSNSQAEFMIRSLPFAVLTLNRTATRRIDILRKNFYHRASFRMLATINATVDAVYRTDWGRILATLIRSFGDFDLAEETAQEAFAA